MKDSDVRAATLAMLGAKHADDASTRIVQEMGIWSGSARIDIAVINGELSGFELKSDRDTLGRLAQQAEIYSLVFDRMTLVVSERHQRKAQSIVPDWWGIIQAIGDRGEVALQPVSAGRINPSPNAFFVAQLLWREEALEALERFQLVKGWRTKPVRQLHQRLAAEVPLELLYAQVRATLKQRSAWLRKPVGDQAKVPIHPYRGPSSSIS